MEGAPYPSLLQQHVCLVWLADGFFFWEKQNHRQGCSIRRIQALCCRQTLTGAGSWRTRGPSTGIWQKLRCLVCNGGSSAYFFRIYRCSFLPDQEFWNDLCLFWCFSSKRLLCDVVIVAETVEMEAHRVVLAACSPYFCAMFTGTLLDTRRCTWVERAIANPEAFGCVSGRSCSTGSRHGQRGKGFFGREAVWLGLRFATPDGWCLVILD